MKSAMAPFYKIHIMVSRYYVQSSYFLHKVHNLLIFVSYAALLFKHLGGQMLSRKEL